MYSFYFNVIAHLYLVHKIIMYIHTRLLTCFCVKYRKYRWAVNNTKFITYDHSTLSSPCAFDMSLILINVFSPIVIIDYYLFLRKYLL